MFALKARKEIAILTSGTRAGVRSLLIAVILFNALMPSAVSTAAALSTSSANQADLVPASIATQGHKGLAIKSSNHVRSRLQQETTPTGLPTDTAILTPQPLNTPSPTGTMSPTLEGTSTAMVTPSRAPTDISISTQASNLSTGLSDLAVELSATPNQAKVGDQVTFTLKIVNNGETPFTGLHFSNFLPEGFNTVHNDVNGFAFDEKTRELSWTAEKETAILAGESLILEYTVSVDLPVQVSQIVDTASLMANELKEPVLVEASLTFSGADDFLTPLDSKGGEALGLDGQVKVSLPKDSLESSAVVSIQDLKPASAPVIDGEPWLVFELGLRAPQLQDAQPLSPGTATGAGENDRAIPLEPVEAKFNKAVELSVSFDGLTDLATLGADQAPFLVTLDEASGTWVRMPLKTIDRENNKVTAELTHFSTWGVGFGPSFPQNGANVLLFDSAYPSLFTGRSNYSIPIWTPPGRNGMQPNLALSYSSGSADGVLGDVQAPWVGMGWSIDTAEIARKITTTSSGYGYENKFMLLLNGKGYELYLDDTTPDRYRTKDESFLYIQRHSDALGSPSTSNATGEWWEVVTKDGTRWRLGYTTGSEQLAAMVGYPGTNPPTGAWLTLGYAGNEPNVVTGRWRVDQVTDVYGNQMTFTYYEESRIVADTSANYNQASYIDTIAYTSHTSGTPSAGYSVVFVRDSRGTNDVPTSPTAWDDWDTYRLDRIEVYYGTAVVRTYDLGYTIRSYNDGPFGVTNWQTTTLTSIATSGSTTLTPIVNTSAPTVAFTYVDKDNRAANGSSSNEWAYPRLATISNGWGGVSTYVYENDGRPYTSWYNWRVKELAIADGVSANPIKTTFAYAIPCYKDACTTGTAELMGYYQTTETKLDFGGSALSKTVHTFMIDPRYPGHEERIQYQDVSGTTLRETDTTYEIISLNADPDGAYLVNRIGVMEYVLPNGSTSDWVRRTQYYSTPTTGNLEWEKEYLPVGLYRTTEYQYVINPDPAVWILNTLWQRTLKDGNGDILSQQQYGYDGSLPGQGGGFLIQGKLMLSRVVNGTHTIDTGYFYDTLGNVTETRQYKAYGNTNSLPNGTFLAYLTTYDTALQTFVVSTDPPLIPATITTYDYGLGLPLTVKDPNNNITTTAYDGLGRVTSVWYPEYAQANVKYTYPIPSGNPLAIAAPFNIKMEVLDESPEPDEYRQAWQIMDGLGRTIQSQGPYETAGTLVLTDTSYDARGMTYYSGAPRTYTGAGGTYYAPTWASVPHSIVSYDALGRTSSVAYADGTSETMSYSGFRTIIKDRNSHQRIQENDVFGRLWKVEEYTGSNPYTLYATTTYQYYANDLLWKVTDTANNVTTINYDIFGRKTEMTDPDLGNRHYRYDPLGNLTAQIDAKRQAINMYYDDLNRLIGKTYTTGPVNADTYQPPIDPTYSGYTVKYYYDEGANGYGHRTSMVDPSVDPSGSTTWTYNVLGQVVNGTQNIDGTNYTASGSYDAFGRPLTQTIPSNGGTESLTYTYNAMGALSGLNNGTTAYISLTTYDAAGRINVRAFGNNTIQTDFGYYSWSTAAQGGRLQQAVTQKTTNLLHAVYGYSTDTPIPADYNGDGKDEVAVYRSSNSTFHVLNQPSVPYGIPGDVPIVGDYNNDNHADIAVFRPSTATFYVKDQFSVAFGLPTDTPIPADYDGDGDTDVAVYRPSTITFYVRNQFSVAYGNPGDTPIPADYDGDGDTDVAVYRPSTATFYVKDQFTAQYGSVGDVPVVKDYNGDGKADIAVFHPATGVWDIKDQYTVQYGDSNDKAVPGDYDGDGKTDVAVFDQASAAWDALQTAGLQNLSYYKYDAVGNVQNIYSPSEIQTFVYDELDRLKSATVTNGPAPYAHTWDYSPIGNITAKNTLTYTYDPNHKHAAMSFSGGNYTYDANGNMTCRVEGGFTYKQEYNFENLLSAVKKMSGTCASGTVLETTSFIYDGDGNLVKKTKPDGSKTLYIAGIYEVDKTSTNTVTRTVTYYPAAGAMRINNTLYYTLKDHLGSTSIVTDISGNKLGEQRYYPYGETRWPTGTINTDKLFTGQREMTGLDIYHYGARFYSPKLGRFLSADTIVPGAANPQAYNRYSYVLNNPLRYTDPTGHGQCQTQEDCDDMGTTPMGTGGSGGGSTGNNGGNGGGGNPHDDDDNDPNPNCVGCETGDDGGGHPLLSLSNDTTQNCQSNPYCFYANQADVFGQANSMFWSGLGFGALGGLAAGIGFGLIAAAFLPTPMSVPALVFGIVLVGVGVGLGLEAGDSLGVSSYLTNIGVSMDTNEVVQFNVQSNAYNAEGTNYSYEPSMPFTSLLMQNWMFDQQNQ